jgi:hypothetical protein
LCRVASAWRSSFYGDRDSKSVVINSPALMLLSIISAAMGALAATCPPTLAETLPWLR